LIEDGLKHLKESNVVVKDDDNWDRLGNEVAKSLRALPDRQRAMAEIDIPGLSFSTSVWI